MAGVAPCSLDKITMDKINLDELIKQAEDLGFEKCILALMQMNELKYYSNGVELAEALKEKKQQILKGGE
jgi:hypothetical protein